MTAPTLPTPSPSLLGRYESWLIDNASTINTIESSIRSLTWFLPGRFKDAELASEALSSSLNLLSLYHDTLLARRIKADPKLRPVIPPSPHSRYTHAWADKSSGYKWVARMLEVVNYLQLVFEMTLRRGLKAKAKTVWRSIILVEFVKAALRLVLLRITRRPVLSPPIPEREIDPATLHDLTPPQTTSNPIDGVPAHLKNNKTGTLPTPGSSRESSPILRAQRSAPHLVVEEFLLPKALSTLDVKPPLTLVRPLASVRDWLSEVIYLLRPLVYVILLSRAARRPHRTSSPLIVSLSMELVAHYLRRAPPPSFTVERQEYARRDRDLLWYFLRGIVWSDFTQPKLNSFVEVTKRVPLINVIGSLVQDWMPLIDEYYYYTAT